MKNCLISLSLSGAAVLACPAALADAPPSEAMPFDNPAYQKPATPWVDLDDALGDGLLTAEERERLKVLRQSACSDAMTQAEGYDLTPLIEPATGASDDAHLIYAVDLREGGCSLMMMANRPGDVRPLPEADGPPQLQPAENAND